MIKKLVIEKKPEYITLILEVESLISKDTFLKFEYAVKLCKSENKKGILIKYNTQDEMINLVDAVIFRNKVKETKLLLGMKVAILEQMGKLRIDKTGHEIIFKNEGLMIKFFENYKAAVAWLMNKTT